MEGDSPENVGSTVNRPVIEQAGYDSTQRNSHIFFQTRLGLNPPLQVCKAQFHQFCAPPYTLTTFKHGPILAKDPS